MRLFVTIDDRTHHLDIPDYILEEGVEFFRKMDRDMDRGWQMGPEFIEHPDQINRCQIAADKLLVSLSTENESMIMLMAGYILKRMPDATGVEIDTAGEMLNTRIIRGEETRAHGGLSATNNEKQKPQTEPDRPELTKFEAMERAGKDVSKVYKSGKAYRFAIHNTETGKWMESEPVDSEHEANEHRMQALKQRFKELLES